MSPIDIDDVQPFNPLDVKNLGETVLGALLARPPVPLMEVGSFIGAGVYALYYTGLEDVYRSISVVNQDLRFEQPIYVGKAVPKGARKGVDVATSINTKQLSVRIREHAKSISMASNLDIIDFSVRWLVVEPIWIPLGESLLIARSAPIWNTLVDGFGNHDPGAGRISGVRSRWDTLHPGRLWAEKYPARLESADDIAQEAKTYQQQQNDFR